MSYTLATATNDGACTLMSEMDTAEPYIDMADEYARTNALLTQPSMDPASERPDVEITFVDLTPPATRAIVDHAYQVYTYTPTFFAALAVALVLHSFVLLWLQYVHDCRVAPPTPINIARKALRTATLARTSSVKRE